MLKKILISGAAVVALLIVVALVLPFVVDFNQFKPQIQEIVKGAVRADLDFKSARLTILTGLGVELEDVSIVHNDDVFAGVSLFAVDSLKFKVDLMPLLDGRLDGYISIKEPQINVAQKGATNNLAALPMPSAEEAKAPEPEEAKELTPEEIAEREKMIEDIKTKVVIRSFAIEDASFHLIDMNKAKPTEMVKVEDLDILVENIGLEQDIITKISTEVAVKDAGINVEGLIAFNLTTQINTQGSEFLKASVNGKLDLDQLAINVQNALVKNQGVPLNVSFAGDATGSSLNLANLEVNVHSLNVGGAAQIDSFERLDTDLQLSVSAPDLKGMGDILPQHKDMLVGGSLDLKLVVDGLLSDLAQLAVNLDVDTKLDGADMTVDLDITNAKAPVLALNVRSQEIDIDRLIGPFLPKETQAAPAEPSAPAAKPETEGPPAEDFALTEEQKTLLKDANVQLDLMFKKINYDTLDIDELVLKAGVKNLKAQLAKFGLQIFDGSILADGVVDLAASPIGFQGHFALNSIETSKMIEFIAPEHKGVMQGKANFDLQLTGQGTTVPTLAKELNGKGTFAFLDGNLNGASVTEELANQLNDFIAGSSITAAAEQTFSEVEKILQNPLLQKAGVGKSFNLQQYKNQYQGFSQVQVSDKMKADQSLKDVKGELEIKDGRIHITSAKASDAGTYDLATSVGIDMTLGGNATFTASEGLKSSMIAQSQYAKLMFDESGNLNLPLSLGGTVVDPKVNVDFAPLKQRFTANARSLVEQEVKGEANKLKDKLLGGKLDVAKEALAKKKAALQQQAAEKKAAAQKKVDDAKQKKQAEAKAKADAEKEKGKDKAKDALKKKIGF